jgi:hypothetical protein
MAVVIWLTNVIAFGVLFWDLERRRDGMHFRFPQEEVAGTEWSPELPDYLYVSLTNSIAFSPTDAMPLTHEAKGLMAIESIGAVVAVLFVVARSVNVLS